MNWKMEVISALAFLIMLCFCLVFITMGCSALAGYDPYTEETTEETTEAVIEPTTEETIVTEPYVPLYDVPIDKELQLHIIETANYHDIDPAIIIAMAWKESTYRVDAIGDGGNSLGLLQVQPRWHSGRMEKLGCPNLLDPYQNVTVACDYLRELINQYGNIDKALTAYNRGHYAGTVTDYARTVLAKADELVVK